MGINAERLYAKWELLITITFQEDTAISATYSNDKALNDEELESIKSSLKDSSFHMRT